MKQTIDFHFESPEESLGYLIWQTSMQWQRQMNRALVEVGITHTQYVILIALAWLSRSSEQVTQVEIADHSNTDRMMVSKILRTLEKNQWIDRKEHPTDTRAKCVYLTNEGKKILQKAIDIKTLANDHFFKKLKNPKEFQNELQRLINEYQE